MEVKSLAGTGSAQIAQNTLTVAANAAASARAAEANKQASIKTETVTPVPSLMSMKQVVESINKQLQPTAGNIEFSVDHDSGKVVIKIVDKKTETVLMQIPSEQALEIAKYIGKFQGLLIKEKV
jgi:flagellar protein FlaG